jgi:hypothetical protein
MTLVGVSSRIAALLLLFTCLCADVAAAQSEAEQRALARALFEEGLQFGEREQWPQAVDRFRRAYELHQSPGVAVNLASALIPTGALVEASELLRGLIDDPGSPRNVHRLAEELLRDEVLPYIARLTIRLEGPGDGVVVTRNETVVPEVVLGMAVPADPGETLVTATRDGETVARSTVEIEPGGAAEVVLTIPERIAAPREVAQQAVAPRPVIDSTDDDGGVATRWWFWTSVGALAVAAGVVAAILLSGEEAAAPVGGNTDPPVLEGVVMP